ncbi:hypothetical protein N7532_000833 [Penicillium argentinense]|uniref:Uncharacterized protein n=1 Tax=Penicillium argentinense TaxID=1131581 RepID=A0A9W9G6G9_9EURO|nr:uncharacterized protein N7532_000833 [Penicillium argentinense]KAJ5112788.1 hypothetical protein N7532_000833 [Penicillium argentinense]
MQSHFYPVFTLAPWLPFNYGVVRAGEGRPSSSRPAADITGSTSSFALVHSSPLICSALFDPIVIDDNESENGHNCDVTGDYNSAESETISNSPSARSVPVDIGFLGDPADSPFVEDSEAGSSPGPVESRSSPKYKDDWYDPAVPEIDDPNDDTDYVESEYGESEYGESDSVDLDYAD